MRSILIATVACVLCAGFTNIAVAEGESFVDGRTTNIDKMMDDLERRIEQLETKIGDEAVETAFRPRGAKVRHLRQPAEASSHD